MSKSKELLKDFQSDEERACVERDSLQKKSIRVDLRHEVLVEQLKDELCKVAHEKQEEACFEVEDTENKINEKFKLDDRKEYFDEHDLESTSDEKKDMLRSMFDE